MSDYDTDQPRAKRRRCAPKRYDEEDHDTAKEDSIKHSPLGSAREQQQHSVLLNQGQPSRHASMHESQVQQSLRVIQQLAARLKQHDRPQLEILFSQTDEDLAELPIRYVAADLTAMLWMFKLRLSVCC